jgi:DNA-binding winged helix-turn-helix (wHTH) protein/TolB-like protein
MRLVVHVTGSALLVPCAWINPRLTVGRKGMWTRDQCHHASGQVIWRCKVKAWRYAKDAMKLRFGEFEFNSETGELWQGTTAIRLQPQPARVLALLIAQPGELVTREALQQHIWGEDRVVDFEQGLNWCIRRLREVLDDIPAKPRFIQTVPRRGYRFVADVKVLAPLEKKPLAASWWKRRGVAAFAICSILLIGITSGVTVSRRQRNVTVLVLPFDNLSIEKGGPPYEDIASAELTSGLARRNPARLSVIDPMTARKFKNTKECIIKIGNQLGADYVLLGDVEQSNGAVKVDAQLFKVSTNRQVWATEQMIPRSSSFSKAWPGMTNSIASVLEVGDVTKE